MLKIYACVQTFTIIQVEIRKGSISGSLFIKFWSTLLRDILCPPSGGGRGQLLSVNHNTFT